MSQGIIVGCDIYQQWMLSWWWQNYSLHNTHPVVFIDFGMSEEAVSWCKERGECLPLVACSSFLLSAEKVPSEVQDSWQKRYGIGALGLSVRRTAWFKKPLSLLQSPFSIGIWIDVDCQVNADLETLFQCVSLGIEIAVARDRVQKTGEVHYNSGVIVFQKNAPILKQWSNIAFEMQHILPGDQDALSRAIARFKPNLIELPPIYNWDRTYGPNERAIIKHFCEGPGKIEILRKFSPQNFIESLLLLQSLQAALK